MTVRLLLISVCLFSTSFVLGQNDPGERSYDLPNGIQASDYSDRWVVVRMKEGITAGVQGRTYGTKAGERRTLSEIAGLLGVQDFTSALPLSTISFGRTMAHPLANLYRIKLSILQDPLEVINQFLRFEEVAYAEPYFKPKPMLTPDDPEAGVTRLQGDFLTVIEAYDGWDISKGDTSVVVAILDTGTKLNHEDLEDNLWINESDPINGIDDDLDGLVDNFFGYDFADDDNDPTADFDGHGTEVSGVSNASTNNGVGMAGIGFNTRYMPLKIFTSENNDFNMGYEAIAFAADKGAKVINLSWGSANSFSQYAQDIINYAVLEKDAVIVAAGGNTPGEFDFYPASFDNVLSIGATNIDDQKTSFTSYSYFMDLVAPGQDVYTTKNDGGYGTNLGTSFSSPTVAGAAALIRSLSPELTAPQVMEKLRVTADDIYDITANVGLEGLLGKGRLNVFKALTDNISPAVRLISFDVATNTPSSGIYYNDTLEIAAMFANYLKPTQNLTVTLSSPSTGIHFLDSTTTVGGLATMDSVYSAYDPFVVAIDPDLIPGSRLVFRIDFKDGFYEDFQYFTITAATDFAVVDNGYLSFGVGGDGSFFYENDSSHLGNPMILATDTITSQLGLVIGLQSDSVVSDNAIRQFSTGQRNNAFETIENIRFYSNSEAAIDARSGFIESDSAGGDIGVKIFQRFLADTVTQGFVIADYNVINQSGATIDTLNVSLFSDWDLGNEHINSALWDYTDSLGYVIFEDSLVAGIALLTPFSPIHYAAEDSVLGDTLTLQEKHLAISGGIQNDSVAVGPQKGEVAHFVGGSIFDFEDNGSRNIGFAVLTGQDLAELKAHRIQARQFYENYKANPPLEYVAYACEGDSAIIDPPGTNYEFYADVNRDSLIFSGSSFLTPPLFDELIFFGVNLDSLYEGDMVKMKATAKDPMADFSWVPDTLFLDENQVFTIAFSDNSINGVAWEWEFNNGFSASTKNPTATFFDPGTYSVGMTVTNDIGCQDSIAQDVIVVGRSPRPILEALAICSGESITIDPPNAGLIRVYGNSALDSILFEGPIYQSGPIAEDSSFFVTSVDSLYESLPGEMVIDVSDVQADFAFLPDTVDFNQKLLLQLSNTSLLGTQFSWKLDGTEFSQAQDAQVNYSGLAFFEISLEVTDSAGCANQKTIELSPAVSPAPEPFENVLICKGEGITINPIGGTLFHFYSDPGLDSLVSKGTRLALENIQDSLIFYIAAVDSLLPSLPEEHRINVSALNADFLLDPDTLNLAEGSIVDFISSAGQATEWFWDFGNGESDTTAVSRSSYTEPGSFEIFLEVRDSFGCVQSMEKILVVVNVVGLESESEGKPSIESRGLLTAIPNPTSNAKEVHLSLPKKITQPLRFRLLNGSGHQVHEGYLTFEDGKSSIDVAGVSPGLYMIELRSRDGRFSTRIIIQ